MARQKRARAPRTAREPAEAAEGVSLTDEPAEDAYGPEDAAELEPEAEDEAEDD